MPPARGKPPQALRKPLGEAAQVAQEAAKEPAMTVAWKGAPRLEGPGGWSFKTARAVLQFDTGFTDSPPLPGVIDGFGSELRRARLGIEGDMPRRFWIQVRS